MNANTLAVTLAVAAFAGAAGYGLQSAMSAPPTLMAPAVYDGAWRSIERDTRAALGRCRGLPESERALCRARARAHDRVQKAELDARYYGTVQAQVHARDVRARARFQVARAECEARAARDRAGCLSQARTEQAKALALAKVAAS